MRLRSLSLVAPRLPAGCLRRARGRAGSRSVRGALRLRVVGQTPASRALPTGVASRSDGATGASSEPAASPSVGATSAPPSAPASGPEVRGVFFFSPTCPHCEKVITEDLPDFFAQSGGAAVVSVDECLDPGRGGLLLHEQRRPPVAGRERGHRRRRPHVHRGLRAPGPGPGRRAAPRHRGRLLHRGGGHPRAPAGHHRGRPGRQGHRLAARARPGRGPGAVPGRGPGSGRGPHGRRARGHAARGDPLDLGAGHA